jgi:hypothetical protein
MADRLEWAYYRGLFQKGTGGGNNTHSNIETFIKETNHMESSSKPQRRLLLIGYFVVVLALGALFFALHAPDRVSNGISYYGQRGFPFVYMREWGNFGGRILFGNVILDFMCFVVVAALLFILYRKLK